MLLMIDILLTQIKFFSHYVTLLYKKDRMQ